LSCSTCQKEITATTLNIDSESAAKRVARPIASSGGKKSSPNVPSSGELGREKRHAVFVVEQVERAIPIANLEQAGTEERLRDIQADGEVDEMA
jgi:hypothetical protein